MAPQTGKIWEEAGFMPPAGYRNLVEYLHCLNTGDDLPEEFCYEICCSLKEGIKEFIITSKERLIDFADYYRISWKGRPDVSIAEDVFFNIVAEYFESGQELQV